MSKTADKHEALEDPREWAGKEGVRCYCWYVHPVNKEGEMDTSRAINEIGGIVLISEIDYVPVFDPDKDWTPYDCF